MVRVPIQFCLHEPSILLMDFSSRIIFLVSVLFIFRFSSASISDTISASHFINETEILTSNNSEFKLGFFNSGNSTSSYVGIWYMSKSAIVWVANRNEPLRDSSGMVTIHDDGNLVVVNAQKKVVWSTNVSNIASNSIAQLLDSGNLVLLDKTAGKTLWESFQHPSNTLLPNMKLSTNVKTGDRVQLTSWKGPSDPSVGRFSTRLEARNVPEVFSWNDDKPYWRSGPWNGHVFLGIPQMNTVYLDGFRLEGEEPMNLYYDYASKSNLKIYMLNPQGQVEEKYWDYGKKDWKLDLIFPYSECDNYGKCGSFGICNLESSPLCSCLRGFEPRNIEEWERQNWTSGCTRKEALQCERVKNGSQVDKADVFLRLQNVKVPDFVEWFSTGDGDCRTPCLKNCSCIAFSYDPGVGCMFWISDLIDIQSFPNGGADLYIRLPYSELDKDRNATAIIAIAVITGTSIIIISMYIMWKRIFQRKGKTHIRSQSESGIEHLKQVTLQELSLFDFVKLSNATNNFDWTNKLGQGGFGPVYKGRFQDGQEIAVKRLSKASGQGIEEFINEVEVISKLQHRNLVRLLGCCIEGEERMLIYEFMPNKSLDAYVFDPPKQKFLEWKKRFNIIEGIARGLLYLHRDSRLKIIHRDLKTSNILLDEEMNPKISDFGMTRIFGGSEDVGNTNRVVGTYGYMSPEYAMEGLFSEKSDVFSFGVLLLEIVSGRRNTGFYSKLESLTLLGFAWKLWNDGSTTSVIDPEISDPCDHMDIFRCIHIGLLCVQELARDRPTMATVISMLNSEIVNLPSPKQPAFTIKQTMLSAATSNQKSDELHSINDVTNTCLQGR